MGIQIINLNPSGGVLSTDFMPLQRTGDEAVKATVGDIVALANPGIPAGTILATNQGIQGGGLIASGLTISMAVNTLSETPSMAVADSFSVNKVSDGNLSRKVTFPNAMKAIAGLPASGSLNLSQDKFVVIKAADGEAYSATASEISLAAGNVPAGGLTAQVLVKASDANYDTEWSSSLYPDQVANVVQAGPASGPAAPPTFRALVGDDLPNPEASSKGGVQSYAAVSNQFLTQISTSGVVSSAQPAFSNISGTATPTQGGTGLTAYAQGDLIYSSATNTLARLAKDTNATRYLANTGTSNNPAWAQINLSNGVTGALGADNGGTGQSSYTIGDLLYASGATALSKLADVATGSLLASGGVGVAPAWSASPTLTTSLTCPLHIGGTGTASALTLKSTSGVGATDAIIFQVGNNGATEAARFNTSGQYLGNASLTNTSPFYSFLGNTATGMYSVGANQLGFATTGANALLIDASQRLLKGTSSSIAFEATSQLNIQTHATDFTGGVSVFRWSANPLGPNSTWSKSRGASVGTQGLVQGGDIAAVLIFTASDGTAFFRAAEITCVIGSSPTPSTNVMPGLLRFSVNSGGTTATPQMELDNTGQLSVGTTSPTRKLDVNGNSIRIRTAKTPSSASDTGVAGEICWDASFIYVCTATNTWKRVAIATW